MTAADLLAWWPQVVTGLGGLGSGGVISGYLTHKRATREQTDEVALSLVEQLRDELKAVRAEQARERELCEANLSSLRHEVANYRTATQMLLMGIELAPDKAAEVVIRVRERLQAVPTVG